MKKKIFIGIISLSVLLIPAFCLAQSPFSQILPGGDPTTWDWSTVGETIENIIQLALYLAAGVAIIYIIIGGYQYIFAFGNPESSEHAKNTITWAIIGLVVALSAVIIVEYIGKEISPHSPEINNPTAPSTAPQGQSSSGSSGSSGSTSNGSSTTSGSSSGNQEQDIEISGQVEINDYPGVDKYKLVLIDQEPEFKISSLEEFKGNVIAQSAEFTGNGPHSFSIKTKMSSENRYYLRPLEKSNSSWMFAAFEGNVINGESGSNFKANIKLDKTGSDSIGIGGR